MNHACKLFAGDLSLAFLVTFWISLVLKR